MRARRFSADWLVSGIFSARSGRPFTVTQGTNNVGPGATGVPNLVGDVEGPQTVEEWFNKAAFALVTSGTFGNSPRNVARGPGWVTFDLSLQREIRFTAALQRDAALGHLQRVQPRELRPSGAQHHGGHGGRHLDAGR